MKSRLLACGAAALLCFACGNSAGDAKKARQAADTEHDAAIADIRGGAYNGSGDPAGAGAYQQINGVPGGPGAGQPADLSRLPAGAIALSRLTINDTGVIRPGPALTVLVPQGWTARGGVMPAPRLCGEPYVVDWAAVSPDGRMSVSLFPTDSWQWSNVGGAPSDCRNADYGSVRDYLAARIAETTPGARLLEYRDRPDFAKAAQEVADMQQQMWNQTVGGGTGPAATNVRFWAEGGEALYAYNENGVEMRGVVGVVATFFETIGQNAMKGSQFDPLGGQDIRTGIGATLGTFKATAPNGALDFQMIEAVRRSITPDPRWLSSLFSLKNKLGEIAVEGARERAAIIVAGGAAATKRNIAAYEAMTNASIANSNASIEAMRPRDGGVFPGDAAGDRMQRESIEAIRGVETYHDPIDNSRVQLDMNYDHAWRVNGSESYILTKDPNFNPGQYGIEATQMGVVR